MRLQKSVKSSDNSEPDYVNLPEADDSSVKVVMRKKGVQKSASSTNAHRLNHLDGNHSRLFLIFYHSVKSSIRSQWE